MKSGRRCFAFLVIFLFIFSAHAATINYGDYTAMTIYYKQVTEESWTDTLPLFGTPTVYQDTLQFNSMSFGSYSSNGSADVTDGKLSSILEAKPGRFIGYINFDEYGDVTLGGQSNNSSADVNNVIFVQVLEVDGSPITPFTETVYMTFSPKKSWTLAGDGIITTLPFNGSVSADIGAMLAKHSISGKATKVQFTLDNTLNTSSQTGTTALIIKKETDGLKVTSYEIPEPATIALLGLGGLVLIRRKR